MVADKKRKANFVELGNLVSLTRTA